MAATVQIHEMSAVTVGVDRTRTGTPPGTPGSNLIVLRANNSNEQNNSNPIQVPVAGTNYSYTKQLRLNVTVAPVTQIENLRCYSDGANNLGTGLDIQYDLSGVFQTQVDTNIVGTGFFTSSSGAPIDMDAINTGPFSGTGYVGDLIRLQMTVDSTAQPGESAPATGEPITFAYDES